MRPQPRAGAIARPRLLRRFREPAWPRVTLIIAPAGFGKTTLLGQVADESPLPVAWVALTEPVLDLRSFLAPLASSLRTVEGCDATRLREVIRDAAHDGAPRLASDALIADLTRFSRPLLLVIDDYHLVDAPTVDAFLQRLIDWLPANARLAVAGRIRPRLSLERLRTAGMLLELAADDLRFTEPEASAFLDHVLDGAFPAAERERLLAFLGGWAAGLRLVALSASRSRSTGVSTLDTFGAHNTLVHDYLLEEVFSQQTPTVQQALVRLSVCRRFSADLLVAMTREPAMVSAFREVVAAGLFVNHLDDAGEWFGFQPLFAEFLRGMLAQRYDRAVVTELHRRAGRWFAERDLHDEAIEHAVAASDWAAAREILRPSVMRFFSLDRCRELRDWLDRFPAAMIEADADLSLISAWVCARLGEENRALQLVEIADRLWRDDGVAMGTVASGMVRAAVYRFRHDGDRLAAQAASNLQTLSTLLGIEAERMTVGDLNDLRLGSTILADVPASTLLIQSAIGFHLIGAARDAERLYADLYACWNEVGPASLIRAVLAGAGSVSIQTGDLRRAHDMLAQALVDPHSALPSERCFALIWLGGLLVEWNDLDRAEVALREAASICDSIQFRTLLPELHLTIARARLARSDRQSAYEHFSRAISHATALGSVCLERQARAKIALMQLAEGDTVGPQAWARVSGVGADDSVDYSRLVEHIALARVLIVTGEGARARALVTRLLDMARADGREGDRVELFAILALAHDALGEPEAAITALEAALRIAQPAGYMRVFLDLGSSMRSLLRDASRRGISPAYVDAILSQSPPEPEQPTNLSLTESLTRREIDVLRLIAAGMSNREIADELFVSLATTKRHITNVYGKLGVTTRSDAVDRGYTLGII